MTILFAGNSTAGFSFANVADQATAGRFDSDYVSAALRLTSSGSDGSRGRLDTPVFAAQSELWFHFEYYHPSATISNTDGGWVDFYSGDNVVVRLQMVNGEMRVYLATSDAGSPTWDFAQYTGVTIAVLALTRLDIRLKLDNTEGAFDIYIDGSLVSSFSGDTIKASSTTIDRIRLWCPSTLSNISYDLDVSQIIVSTTDSRNLRCKPSVPTGAGTTNTFDSGAYTDVDEAGVADDADYLAATANDQLFLGTVADAPTGAAPVAVVLNARALSNSGSLLNAQLAVRSGTTNYFSGDIALEAGFSPISNVWETDPDTAAAWTESGFNAIEAGVRART
jgi:hypothetical protein